MLECYFEEFSNQIWLVAVNVCSGILFEVDKFVRARRHRAPLPGRSGSDGR